MYIAYYIVLRHDDSVCVTTAELFCSPFINQLKRRQLYYYKYICTGRLGYIMHIYSTTRLYYYNIKYRVLVLTRLFDDFIVTS